MVSRIYSLLPGACTYLCRRRSAAPRPHPSPRLSFAALTRRVHVQPTNTHLLQNTFFRRLSPSVREILFPRFCDIFFFSSCCPIFHFYFFIFFLPTHCYDITIRNMAGMWRWTDYRSVSLLWSLTYTFFSPCLKSRNVPRQKNSAKTTHNPGIDGFSNLPLGSNKNFLRV